MVVFHFKGTSNLRYTIDVSHMIFEWYAEKTPYIELRVTIMNQVTKLF